VYGNTSERWLSPFDVASRACDVEGVFYLDTETGAAETPVDAVLHMMDAFLSIEGRYIASSKSIITHLESLRPTRWDLP